jgi:polysaccharide biosynthesis protein PslH
MPLKILMLTHRVPYPLNDGGAMGVHYFLEGFINAGAQVGLLSLNTQKHFVDTSTLNGVFQKLLFLKTVAINTNINAISAFLNLFTTQSYHIARFKSKAFDEALIKILAANTFDYIYVDNIYLGHYLNTIAAYTRGKIIIRVHNIEHLIWQNLANNETRFFKKKYLQFLANRLKKQEIEYVNQAHLLFTINKNDAITLKNIKVSTPQYLLPFGISCNSNTILLAPTVSNSICFLASMDWLPNQEALDWFLKNVWPLLQNENIQLHVAGKNMPQKYLNIQKEKITIHGQIADATAFLNTYNIVIVPLQSGAGIRVKILEAMALGKNIVSTTIGASGIDYTDNKNIFIADDAMAFANTIKKVMALPTINNYATALVTAQYNSSTIFDSAMQHLLKLQMCKPKIIILLNRFPYPLEKGDKLRAYHQIKSLSLAFDITLIALSAFKITPKDKAMLEPYCTQIFIIKYNKYLQAICTPFYFFNKLPLQVSFYKNYFIKKQIDTIILDTNPNLLYCQLARMAQYFVNWPFYKILDLQDAFSNNYLRSYQESSGLKKIIFGIEQKRMAAYEQRLIRRFDNNVIISEADKTYLKYKNIAVVKNGVDTHFFKSDNATKTHDLLFVGNLGYEPNIRAVAFLVHQIMPLLLAQQPHITLLIAGANPSAAMLKLASNNITIQAWLPDIRTAYNSCKIFVAPLFTGAGLQNKILEAMAMELPCITTTIVNAAINATENTQILIANDATTFCNKIIHVLQNEALQKELQYNSKAFVDEHYSWQKHNTVLTNLINSTITNRY